jgi:hypothetical protein
VTAEAAIILARLRIRILLGFVACAQRNQAGPRPAEEAPYSGLRNQPAAELVVVADSGHTGSTAMEHALDAAADRLFTVISEPTMPIPGPLRPSPEPAGEE